MEGKRKKVKLNREKDLRMIVRVAGAGIRMGFLELRSRLRLRMLRSYWAGPRLRMLRQRQTMLTRISCSLLKPGLRLLWCFLLGTLPIQTGCLATPTTVGPSSSGGAGAGGWNATTTATSAACTSNGTVTSQTWGYVVVGAGAGGIPLADKLSGMTVQLSLTQTPKYMVQTSSS